MPAPPALRLLNSNPQLSDVAQVVGENYGVCHETAQQLIDLQTWVKNQKDLKQ